MENNYVILDDNNTLNITECIDKKNIDSVILETSNITECIDKKNIDSVILDDETSNTTEYTCKNINSKINIIEYIIKNDYESFCYYYDKCDQKDIFDVVCYTIKYNCDIKYLNYIISEGYDINIKKNGMTLLGYAILEEKLDVVNILVLQATDIIINNKLVIGNINLKHLLSVSDIRNFGEYSFKSDRISEENISYLISYLHYDKKKIKKLLNNIDNNFVDVLPTSLLIINSAYVLSYYPLKLFAYLRLYSMYFICPLFCCCICCVTPSVISYKCLCYGECCKKPKPSPSNEFRKKYKYANSKRKIKSQDLIQKYEEIKYTPDNFGNIFTEIKFRFDNKDFDINKFIIGKPKLKLLFGVYDKKSYFNLIKKYDL